MVRRALVALGLLVATGAASRPARAAVPRKPKLVVVLAVDQMRGDYVDTYRRFWKGGFKRLLDRGAWFRNAAFPYLGTVTCPGHATIGTGAYPRKHGMILNAWWDRKTGRLVQCTDDPESSLVPYAGAEAPKGTGESGKLLQVPTLSDAVKAQPDGRVVSFSMKARAAVMLGGHKPDAVTWFEGGTWVTSRVFSEAPVPWVDKLVRANPLDQALAQVWDRKLPASSYLWPDDSGDEKPPAGWSRVFPHPITPKDLDPSLNARKVVVKLWEQSPLSDAQLARFARGAVSALKLGKGKGTDMLAISFSSLDRIGHGFGPRSQEVQDVLVRLDAELGALFTDLDKQVGAQNYVVALTADHGVAVYPEQLEPSGEDAGRVPMDEVKQKLQAALVTVLGPGEHVAMIQYTDLYLAPGVLDKLRKRPAAMKAALDAVRSVSGVAAAYSTDELRDPAKATDPGQRAAALSHFPERSGDIVLLPKKNWLTVATGTTHGTHNEYDQHVPVFLMGGGIKPGTYDRPITPADIAPTLAAMIGVPLPDADGAPLTEALTSSSLTAGSAPSR